MKQKHFTVGEWIFCEFKLQQIKTMTDGRVTGVTDGMFEHGSYDLSDRAFKLNMTIKKISDTASYWYAEFHKLKNAGLNHPRLHARLVEKWAIACGSIENEELTEKLHQEISDFGKSVIDKVNELSRNEVEGVPLFRS